MEELAAAAFADPTGPVATAALALPEDPEALGEAIISITWTMGVAAKWWWPIPDRGLRKRIHRITADTLVVWGTQDGIISPEYAHDFGRLIRNCQVEMLPNAAHVAQLERFDVPVGGGNRGGPVSSSFVQERRNAFYVTLDLSTPDGRELFLRLVRTRDIWMESSKPGTYAKWGLADDVVLAANPALVVTHVSGYGQTGDPGYLGRASYDMVGQAFGGLMFQTGFADPDPPVRAAPYTGDYITALFALWSSLAAYIHAQRTGEGQVVDLAQFEAVHQILAGTMVQYFDSGTVRARSGNKAPNFQPYDVFPAADGWVVLGAAGAIFARVCAVIGLDPEKYAPAASDLACDEGVDFDIRL